VAAMAADPGEELRALGAFWKARLDKVL